MRSKYAILNILSGWLGQISLIVLTLLSRKMFLRYLGEFYLGLNGLLSNIIAFLAMADLGVGVAISYSLYKPIANHDEESLKAIMGFFKKVYFITGITIIVLGIITVPFLPQIVGQENNIDGLPVIFFIFLFNTAITYFFSYKSSLIFANQKGFVFNINHYLWQFAMYGVQILTLTLTRNYYVFLIVQFLTTLLENIVISHIANKMYPFLKEKNTNKVDQETKQEIRKNTFSLILTSIGSTLVNSTDNILISTLVNVVSVARFNNYSTIYVAASGFLYKGVTATVSSVGNFSVNESRERKIQIFDLYYHLCTWLYGWLAIGIFFLLPRFVGLFYGDKYILDQSVILCMALNTFLDGQIVLFTVFTSAMGLYWHIRYLGAIEAVINLVISIVLGKIYGITGIILGTFFSKFLYSYWIRSKVVINQGLQHNRRAYFSTYLRDSIAVLCTSTIIFFLSTSLSSLPHIYFIEMLLICLIVPNILFYILYRKSEAYGMFKNILQNTIVRKLKKQKDIRE